MTTNDNLPAIHFYLRRGLHVAAVHEGAVDADRALKPEIPAVNPLNGLPIRDLIEMELVGDGAGTPAADAPPSPAWPTSTSCRSRHSCPRWRRWSRAQPAFLEAMAGSRPLETDERLVAAAFEIAHALPEEARVQLIDAHPPIGAAADAVSALSSVEQGYAPTAVAVASALAADGDGVYEEESLFSDAELAEEAAAQRAAELRRADEELAMLNELYEQRFGFRYVIFVAGRPRDEIVPLLEHALRQRPGVGAAPRGRRRDLHRRRTGCAGCAAWTARPDRRG